MLVTVNGQPRQLPDGTSVTALISLQRLAPDRVAVELNGKLLRSPKYDTILKDGDAVEIVTFVGGG